jgi:Arc/MetJ family transcription regulator
VEIQLIANCAMSWALGKAPIALYTQICDYYTSEEFTMRTNIDIDDSLMRQAMRLGGIDTKKATVEAALRLFIQTRTQVGMRRFRGKVKWEGNLEESRLGRNSG